MLAGRPVLWRYLRVAGVRNFLCVPGPGVDAREAREAREAQIARYAREKQNPALKELDAAMRRSRSAP
jgi:hypothetical protein